MSAEDSAGTITVQRRIAPSSWETGLADLRVEHGELVATADAAGDITIERFAVTLAPIEIPESVFGRPAALSNVRAKLDVPARVTTTWSDDDTARLATSLDLSFSWSLTVDGSTAELGAPDLPPVAIEVELGGDGSFVHADVRAGASGDVWGWAGLVKLQDLNLVLAADTF